MELEIFLAVVMESKCLDRIQSMVKPVRRLNSHMHRYGKADLSAFWRRKPQRYEGLLASALVPEMGIPLTRSANR